MPAMIALATVPTIGSTRAVRSANLARMADRSDARGVLVTGAFGVGKTALIEEAAEVLEEHRIRYAAIDLDGLCWFDPGSEDHAAAVPTLLKNIDAVVGNYYDAGVRVFALARAMDTQRDVDAVGAALAMSMTTVRLTAPLEEIERRLAGSVTAGRATDLRMAREWFAAGGHDEIGDLVIANDRPIREVAAEMLAALGWL